MAGRLNFDGETNRNNLLLLNKELDILELSVHAGNFFKKSSNIIEYGPSIYDHLNKVIESVPEGYSCTPLTGAEANNTQTAYVP